VYEGDSEAPAISLQTPYDAAQSGDRVILSCDLLNNLESLADLAITADDCDQPIDVDYMVELHEAINCDAGHLGVYKLTWKASDACGNQSIFELLVEIEAPNLHNLIADEVLDLTCGSSTPELEIAQCIQSISEVGSDILSFCDGQQSFVAFEITGLCGEQVMDTLWMRLTDDQPPVFNELPTSICKDDVLPVARAWDECEQRFVPVTVYEFHEDICGLPLTVLSFSAIDDCGNEARHDVTLIPSQLEVNFSLFYDDLPITFDQGAWPFWEGLCPFELDVSKFRLLPECPIVSLDVDYELLNDNCSNSSIYEFRYYTISLESACGLVKDFHLNVPLRDWEAPLFLDLPMDISICADDNYEMPEINALDRCSEVVVNGVMIPESIEGGVEIWTEQWTAIDDCGNTTQHSRLVTNFTEPVIDIIIPANIPCHSLVRLTSNVQPTGPHYTYQWMVSQGNCVIVNEQSEQEYVDIIMSSDSAVVILYVENDYGCVSMMEVVIYCTDKPQITMSFGDHSSVVSHAQLALYPNPVDDLLHIYSDEMMKVITLYDMQGRKLIHRKLNEVSTSIDVGELNSGVFMIRVELLTGDIEIRKVAVR
jgi:hypothetical protein